MADRYHLNEVLVNLISNAIKYSPKANTVYVRASKQDHSLLFEIEDFGIGISQKDQAKIFERFFRAENRIRQSFSGLGLGLYISHEIKQIVKNIGADGYLAKPFDMSNLLAIVEKHIV